MDAVEHLLSFHFVLFGLFKGLFFKVLEGGDDIVTDLELRRVLDEFLDGLCFDIAVEMICGLEIFCVESGWEPVVVRRGDFHVAERLLEEAVPPALLPLLDSVLFEFFF